MTGALYYGNQRFIQVLEGSEYDVLKLYVKIMADKRHHGLKTLLISPITKRYFSRWWMGRINHFERENEFLDLIQLTEKKEGVWNAPAMNDIIRIFSKRIKP